MKIALKGFYETNFKIYERLKSISGIEIVAFTDNNTIKWNEDYQGVECISPFELVRKYKDKEVDKVVLNTIWNIRVCYDVYRELIELGIKADDIVFLPVAFCYGNDDEYMLCKFDELKYLFYLEFHITNRCNLNCAGCSHFVPLMPKDDEIDYDSLKKDLAQLKTKVEHFNEIRIMGGEPFLCDHLKDIIEYVRELYPYSQIHVVTNGIKLLSQDDELENVIKKNNAKINISCYPPLHDKYDSIIQRLKERNIPYIFGINKWGMRQCFHSKREETFPYANVYDICVCINLYKGKLWTCPEQAYLQFFNLYFHMNLPQMEGIDIYSDISFEELKKRIYSVDELCHYCNRVLFDIHDYKQFETCNGNPKLESWCTDGVTKG